MAFGATIDTSALSRNAVRLGNLASIARERVVTRTIATMRRKTLTDARRAISQEYGIGTQAIGRRMTAESGKDSLSIYGTTGKVPLHEFGGRYSGPKSAGASAEILRGNRRVYTSAFTIKNRNPAIIYARPIIDGARRAPKRFVRLHGPSVESMFLGGGTGGQTPATQVIAAAQEIFSAEVERLIFVEESK